MVATPKKANPCHDIKTMSRHQFLHIVSRHQNGVTTPLQPTVGVSSRDTLAASLCRDTKDLVVTDLSSHAAFVSQRQRPFRDTLNSCPLSRHKNHVATLNQPSPIPAMSRHKIDVATWGPEETGRAHAQRCSARCCWPLHTGQAMSRLSVCSLARTCALPVATQHTVSRPEQEVGSSPLQLLPYTHLFIYFFQNSLVALQPLLGSYSLYKTCYLYTSQIKEYNHNPFSCSKTGIIFQNSTKHNLFFFYFFLWTILPIIPRTPKVIFSQS